MQSGSPGDEDSLPAFSNIRQRFEQLSAGGPAGPLRPSGVQSSALRVASDNLHTKDPSTRLDVPSSSPQILSLSSSFRNRALSNPHTSLMEKPLAQPGPSHRPVPPPPPRANATLPPPAAHEQAPTRLATKSAPPLPLSKKPPPPPPPMPSRPTLSISPSQNAVDDTSVIATESFTSLRAKFSEPPSSPSKTAKPLMTRPVSPSLPNLASLASSNEHEPYPITIPRSPSLRASASLLSPDDSRTDGSIFSEPRTPPRPGSMVSMPTSPILPPRRSLSPPPLPLRHRPTLSAPSHTTGPTFSVRDIDGDSGTTHHFDSIDSDPFGGVSESRATPLRPPPTRPLSPNPIGASLVSSARPPPPVPPRPSVHTTSSDPLSLIFHAPPSHPPPLPSRKVSSSDMGFDRTPPNLPARAPSLPLLSLEGSTHTPPPLPPHRPPRPSPSPATVGILPPPTRLVGSKDLPPRHSMNIHIEDGSEESSGSSEGDEDAESPPAASSSFSNSNTAPRKRPDDLPDSSSSSRRVPSFSPGLEITVPAHVGIVAVAGNCVCIASHHIRVYDLASRDTVFVFDVREVGLELRAKEHHRVTAMAFRPAVNKADEGRYVWCGLRDGHLFEFDAWTGSLSDVRSGAHSGAVTHIFRYGRSMVTMCDAGKALIFSPPPRGDDHLEGGDMNGASRLADLSLSNPANVRHVRIAEKQGFARVFGDQLWTSNGPGASASAPGANTSLRGPSVRVYELRAGGSVNASTPRTLIPGEPVGAVTSGAILPSRPDEVYLGHEGGVVSVWSRGSGTAAAGDGGPAWMYVVKVGVTDVLSLEGVQKRLWAGFRTGFISAYNVENMRWTVTNTWRAHEEYPVLKLEVDPYSIEKCAQLTVYSVGRDERLRLWDGLLGVDNIELELLKRETRFSTFSDLKVLICSWNIDATKPESLSSNGESVSFLIDCLHSIGQGDDAPEIIVFGFQEVIDLESRKLTAKTVLLGKKKKGADGSLSEKVSKHYRLWLDQLVLAIRTAMPTECPYAVVHTENLVGLLSCVFVKVSDRHRVKDTAITTVKRGMKGRYGNKGAIAARFTIDDTSICFINCHLAAGQKHVRERGRDLAAILEEKSVFPETNPDTPYAFVGGGDGSMVLDHEICFLSGDLNYRIDLRRDTVISSIRANDLAYLLQHDQLLKEMSTNPSFRLRTFQEAGPITFIPTYKYDRRTSDFDTSEKKRIPAWCDRILYRTRTPERVECLQYRRYEANISDHRPISAGFRVRIKKVDVERREAEKSGVEREWRIMEQELLLQAHAFYVRELRL